jgi:large subunit ribosomal protein L17
MRHGDKVNNLGRKKGHRVALLRNMSCALIEHKRITTTLAKAKALRIYVEPVLTRAKDNTTHSRRMAFSYLNSKEAAKELYGVIAPKIADRPGGYTRIIKLGNRKGDGAEMALIELVDFNELLLSDKAEGANKKKRTRRGSKVATTTSTTATTSEEAVVDATEQTNDQTEA